MIVAEGLDVHIMKNIRYKQLVLMCLLLVFLDFNASHHARNAEFSTSVDDRPLVVQFGAKSALALATAAERVVG